MLAFITSLRHPQNSADYTRVERLLSATLRSVTNQSSSEYVVIVVGNRAPTFPLPEQVHFVPVDFGPPAPPDGPRTAREPFVRDKGSKIAVGLIYAQRFRPDHVMIFDADDFVHHSIAGWSAARPGATGWVVEHGYVLSSSRQVYREQLEFNKTCGTCMIVAYQHYDVPAHLTVKTPQDVVIDAFGDTLWRVLGAHREGVEWFASHDIVLEPLPFHGAIYHVDTGENHSGKQLGGIARPIGSTLAADFGLERRGSTARRLWSAVGPRPVGQSVKAASKRRPRRTR